MARLAAAVREVTPSLLRMLATCVIAVRGLTESASAISRSERPSASRRSTSRSRSVKRDDGRDCARAGADCAAPINRSTPATKPARTPSSGTVAASAAVTARAAANSRAASSPRACVT